MIVVWQAKPLSGDSISVFLSTEADVLFIYACGDPDHRDNVHRVEETLGNIDPQMLPVAGRIESELLFDLKVFRLGTNDPCGPGFAQHVAPFIGCELQISLLGCAHDSLVTGYNLMNIECLF